MKDIYIHNEYRMMIKIPDREHAGLIVNRLYELGYDWEEQQNPYLLWDRGLCMVLTKLSNKSIRFLFTDIHPCKADWSTKINYKVHTLVSLYTQEIIDIHRI